MYYSINEVDWDAVFRCLNDYRTKYPGDKRGYDYEHNHDHYNNYMQSNWGIDHNIEYLRVIDEQKYMMFLLRWA